MDVLLSVIFSPSLGDVATELFGSDPTVPGCARRSALCLHVTTFLDLGICGHGCPGDLITRFFCSYLAFCLASFLPCRFSLRSFFLVQTKTSWHSLLTSQYAR